MPSNSSLLQIVDALPVSGKAASDGALLRQFIQKREEATFAMLMQRHGTMVFHVCRRVLSQNHDIEDAFQMTFLALVQQAARLQHRETVGDWLHGVALHTALKARAMNCKRVTKERSAARPDAVEPMQVVDSWQQILDEEIRRLPARYREALVQCDLEQKTRKEAALVLGWNEGTVASRLSRGRTILCKRLRARGIEITAILLAAELASSAQAASVPLPLIQTVTKTVCQLVNGVAPKAAVSVPVVSVMKSALATAMNHKASVALVFFAGAVAVTSWGLIVKAKPPEMAQTSSLPLPSTIAYSPARASMASQAASQPPIPKVNSRAGSGSDEEILSILALTDEQIVDFLALRQTLHDQTQEMFRMPTGRRERGLEINREWNAGLAMIFTPEQYAEYCRYWEERSVRLANKMN